MTCHCYAADGTCADFVPKAANYDNIKFPVGEIEGKRPNGNVANDVRTIQKLINLIPASEGTPYEELAVDGICGPLTRGAIKSFQAKQFPAKVPDVIVDPDQTTLYRMNELAYPDLEQELLETARANLALLATYIARTLMEISVIEAAWALPNPLFSPDKEIARLNYHFHLDRSTDKSRDMLFIRRTYQDMLMVCGYLPKGPSQKPAFGFLDVRPHEAEGPVYYAWATPGGWKYLQGVEGQSKTFHMDLRADHIYLTRALFSANSGAIGYGISHELAHYVGGRSGDIDHIKDRAYYHRNKAKYEALDAYEAMTNGDSYAQYNWEVNRGYRYAP